jgi:alkylhydroperoxidase family enzyme
VVLGRSAGLDDAKLAHIAHDPLPYEVYSDEEQAIVRYARTSTRSQPIDDALYADLSKFLSTQQLMELCFTVGPANLINRFHATFRTDLDAGTGREGDHSTRSSSRRRNGHRSNNSR